MIEPTHRDVPITMRDGIRLHHDVYLPSDPHWSVPFVLLRTPYNRTSPRISQMVDVQRTLGRGYGVAVQDMRGRYSSEGVFQPFRQEIEDGYDTVEAIASGPGCSGDVVMVGSSYPGSACWLAALSSPPHLRAIAPHLCAADMYEDWAYRGGTFQLAFNLFWAVQSIGPEDARRRGLRDDVGADPIVDSREPWNFGPTVGERFGQISSMFERVPLSDLEEDRYVPEFYRKWLSEPNGASPYWRHVSAVDGADSITCAVMSIGGWYQSFLRGAYGGFSAVRWTGGSEAAREGSRLVLGPWQNSMPSPQNQRAGVVDFTPAAGIDLHDCEFEFFDSVIGRGGRGPRVRYFLMGANEWRDADEWPPPKVRPVVLHLHAGGHLAGDRPAPEPSSTAFEVTPDEPVPTTGGNTIPGLPQGPQDHSSLDERSDVAVFTTDPLVDPIDIVGPVRVALHVDTATGSADWTAMLSYARPDGSVINICDGVTREMNAPGRHVVVIDLHDTAVRIESGSCLHLRLGATNFPLFDRNPNSGLATRDASDLWPNQLEVHHGGDGCSRVEFMVLGVP